MSREERAGRSPANMLSHVVPLDPDHVEASGRAIGCSEVSQGIPDLNLA
jgi:hypothetical protein